MPDRQDEPSSPHLVGVLSLVRRRRLVGLCGAAFLVAGLLVAVLRPPTFTASAQLLVYTRELHPGPESVVSAGRADVALVQNQIEIIRSPSTLRRVIRALNLADDPEFVSAGSLFASRPVTSDENRIKTERALATLEKKLTVTRVGVSHTILIRVTTANPDKSARIANEIVRNAPQQGASEDAGASRGTPLRERLRGLGPSTYVMSRADPPVRPDGPRKLLIVAGMGLLGLVLGGALAGLLDLRDRTIRTAEQVDSLGLECLGPVPRLRGRRAPGKDLRSWALERPDSMLAQTLRRAKTAILASDARRIGVTAAVGGDGASTMAMNLAHLVARSGRTVLFVGAAGAKPSSATPGAGERTAGAAGRPWSAPKPVLDERGGFHVLAIDAPETAASWSGLDKALETADAYDLVIVDLPPLARAAEFRASAQKLHGLLLVLKWGDTELEQVRESMELCGGARRKFIGAILNMVDERRIGTYGDKLWGAEAGLVARRRAGAASGTAGHADLVRAGVGLGS